MDENKGNQGQNNDEVITISKADLDKKLQGEGDRVRTEYSRKIKELEGKIKELTPVEKTQAEIDFDNRLAALEAKEKRMNLLDTLTANNLSHDLADYLSADADVSAFGKVFQSAIDAAVNKKLTDNGYNPQGHKSGESITKEEFAKMSLEKKEQLYRDNPELYKTLSKH